MGQIWMIDLICLLFLQMLNMCTHVSGLWRTRCLRDNDKKEVNT